MSRLVRTDEDIIAGVCGGIARYIGINMTLLRLVYAFLTLFTAFAGVAIYIILWIIIPKE